MDSIASTNNEASLADLMRRAASLWPALADTELSDAPEAFQTVIYAAAGLTHLPTLAQLAIRAGQLWQAPDGPADERGAVAGALPEHASLPVLSSALATARQAEVKVAVLGGRGSFMWAYGENGAQGAFFFPEGNGVEIQWFIDGRHNESCLRGRKLQAVRTARNERLAEIGTAFAAAGWSTMDKISSNTHTLRRLSVIAHPPQLAQ
ncbi:hypothetical protein ACFYZ8_34335 [Streptomyces sp. NPDC001668]|uniref:hypothetical protein n=1 Tax=Streptomyces sp. NPDC001668 TaxID=3364598 RepID=UPI00369FCDDA